MFSSYPLIIFGMFSFWCIFSVLPLDVSFFISLAYFYSIVDL
jgi:hypothetical protein